MDHNDLIHSWPYYWILNTAWTDIRSYLISINFGNAQKMPQFYFYCDTRCQCRNAGVRLWKQSECLQVGIETLLTSKAASKATIITQGNIKLSNEWNLKNKIYTKWMPAMCHSPLKYAKGIGTGRLWKRYLKELLILYHLNETEVITEISKVILRNF